MLADMGKDDPPRSRREGDDRSPAERPAADPSGSLLEFLVDATRDLNSTLHLDEVFRRVAARIRPHVDFHLFCVLLWNEGTRRLEHRSAIRKGQEIEVEGGLQLGYGISGMAALNRRPYRVGDVTRDDTYVRFPHEGLAIRSGLAIPLVLKDRLIGVLDLESEEPDAFTAEHEQILTAVASHIAVAVDNARLYEQVEAQERHLRRDLAAAREVQNSLLPDRAPRVNGATIGTAYLPADQLGGDFFEFVPLSEGRLGVAVGDVSGKGTPAALYASLAVGMLRGLILESPGGPSAVLGHLNARLHPRMAEGRFVALAYAVFDGAERTLDLAGAGFPQPVLVRDGSLERIRVRGLPLGLFPDARYDELRVRLQPGDVVAFLSDGLQEAIDGSDREFGDRFFEDVAKALARLPAQDIAAGFLRANTAYAGEDEERPDDRAVVVLKVS